MFGELYYFVMIIIILESSLDHRTRVAQLRKEKMRLHLMESALELLCTTDCSHSLLINDFITFAGVSRGTFYNYFLSTNDLFNDIIIQLSDEVLEIIEPLIRNNENPLSRIYIATDMYLKTVAKYPLWGNLLTNAGSRSTIRGKNISLNFTRDLKLAIEKKLVVVEDIRVSRDIFLGSIYYSLETILSEKVDNNYINIVMNQILKNLGVSHDNIEYLTSLDTSLNIKISSSLFSILEKYKEINNSITH